VSVTTTKDLSVGATLSSVSTVTTAKSPAPKQGPVDARLRALPPSEVALAEADDRQVQIHTAMPGIIVSFDPSKQTATVQPGLQGVQSNADGTRTPVSIKPIQDVPVIFPAGGGHTLTFPVKAGDECWLMFAERSIDNWHQHGGVQQPSDWRMHDITDAVCLVGLRSQAKQLTGGVDTQATMLRSDDATSVISINGPQTLITIETGGSGGDSITVDGKSHIVTVSTKNTTILSNFINIGRATDEIGMFGGGPVNKGTITGSRNNNPALTNLLIYLASRGDIVNNTTN